MLTFGKKKIILDYLVSRFNKTVCENANALGIFSSYDYILFKKNLKTKTICLKLDPKKYVSMK